MDIGSAIKEGDQVYAYVWEMKTPWEKGIKAGQVELVKTVRRDGLPISPFF